jgi:hypothetical protein
VAHDAAVGQEAREEHRAQNRYPHACERVVRKRARAVRRVEVRQVDLRRTQVEASFCFAITRQCFGG